MSVSMVELVAGERIGTLVTPAGVPTGGVVIAHGGSDDGRHFFVDEAREFADRGIAVLLPVTRLPVHGDIAATQTAITRSVRTHRWALDVLGERTSRLGFYGHSAGAFLGSLLSAVDRRPEVIVLAGFGSGTLVRLARTELLQQNHPDPDPYLEALQRFDPRHHLPHRHPARLLVQHGRADETVPIAEARALHAAAGPDARWAEYDCGHAIDADPDARRDRLAFFGFTSE